MKKIAIFSLIGLCLVGAGWGSHELYVALKPYNLGDYDVTNGKVRSKNVPNGANTDSLLVVNNSTREFRRITPISTTLAGYPTNSQLTSALSGYVTTTHLSSQLSSYATTASVNTGLSGKANNSNTITVNGVSATLGSNPNFNIPVPGTPSYSNSPTRSLVTTTTATGVQISTTKATRVSYTVTHSIALTLLLTSGSSQVYLEISPSNASGSWIEISRAGYSDGVAVAVAITKTTSNNVQGEVPAGWYVRLRSVTSGAGSAIFTSGQEVQY